MTRVIKISKLTVLTRMTAKMMTTVNGFTMMITMTRMAGMKKGAGLDDWFD